MNPDNAIQSIRRILADLLYGNLIAPSSKERQELIALMTLGAEAMEACQRVDAGEALEGSEVEILQRFLQAPPQSPALAHEGQGKEASAASKAPTRR